MKYSKTKLDKYGMRFTFLSDEHFVYLEVKNNNNYIKKIKLSNNMIDDLHKNSLILDTMLDDCLKHTRKKKLKALNEI